MRNLLAITARNSFFSTFGKLSVKAISFIFTVIIIRWLGDADYGQYVVVWSFVMVFAMLSDAGLSMFAIREVAKKKPGSQYIAGNIIVLRIILAVVTMLLIVATAWFLGYSDQFLIYVFLASAVLLLYAVQDPLDAMLQAHERFDLAAMAVIAGQLVFVGVGLILLLAGWHIIGLIIAGLLSVLVSALAAWQAMRSYRETLQWRLQPTLWLGFLRSALPFGLIKLWLSWSLKIGIIILSWFWLDQMAGWYGAAFAIILGILVVSNAINTALYPTLSRQYVQDPASMPQIYELALKYLIVISLPITGGIFLTAGNWIDSLYGSEFAPATAALAILIWTIPFAFVTEFLRYVLLATDRERIAVQALGLTVLFGILLSLWWIPIYGFQAAAIIVVVSEALLLLLYVWYLRAELKSLNLVNILFAPLFATLMMMAIVRALSPFPLLWQIIFGGVTYTILIWI